MQRLNFPRGLLWGISFVALSLICLGMVFACYFAWAWHRVSPEMLMRAEVWPRPAPYPDAWLIELNDYYDRKHPVTPGHIKIHGELDRVRFTVLCGIAVSLAIAATGSVAYGVVCFLRKIAGKSLVSDEVTNEPSELGR